MPPKRKLDFPSNTADEQRKQKETSDLYTDPLPSTSSSAQPSSKSKKKTFSEDEIQEFFEQSDDEMFGESESEDDFILSSSEEETTDDENDVIVVQIQAHQPSIQNTSSSHANIASTSDQNRNDSTPIIQSQGPTFHNGNNQPPITTAAALSPRPSPPPQQPTPAPPQPSLTTAAAITPTPWMDQNPSQPTIPFTAKPGLKVIPCGRQPIDFFRMLANDEFFDHVVNETNIYGAARKGSSSSRRSRSSTWKDTSRQEFERFIALVYMTGQIQTPDIPRLWKKSRIYNFPTITTIMGRDRFLLLLRSLHFGRNPPAGDSKPEDPLYKIRPLINLFHKNMDAVVHPKKELNLDESMLLWRGRLYFRQFIGNKKHKYGIKIYVLAQPDGLVLRTLVYTGGKDKEYGGKGHTEKVVKKLMEDYIGSGHSLYMDNFYNSVGLAKELLLVKTFCSGNLKKTRKDIPKDVVNKKLAKGEIFQQFSPEGICVVKWYDKREVLLLSSEHDGTIVEQTIRGKKVNKPKVVFHYNKHMGGIDKSDQLMAYYPCERKRLRWHAKLGLHYFHIIMNNSFNLYCAETKETMRLIQFRDSVIEALLGPATDSRISLNISPLQSRRVHLPAKVENARLQRKNCRVCTRNKSRKNSVYICPDCPNQPGLCLDPCFRIFHEY